MTDTSKQGRKGILLSNIQKGLEKDASFSEEQLSFILRDILTIVLQRDRYSYSFYGTTTSGLALVKAFNQSEFRAIQELIQFEGKPVEYSDLSAYVLGRNDSAHFNSQAKKSNLDHITEHELGEDGYRMLI